MVGGCETSWFGSNRLRYLITGLFFMTGRKDPYHIFELAINKHGLALNSPKRVPWGHMSTPKPNGYTLHNQLSQTPPWS